MPQPLLENPHLDRMSRLVRRLSFGFTFAIALAYIALNLASLYAPDWLAAPLMEDGFVSRGITLGIALIVLGVVATGIFVRVLNRRLDRLRAEIGEEPR